MLGSTDIIGCSLFNKEVFFISMIFTINLIAVVIVAYNLLDVVVVCADDVYNRIDVNAIFIFFFVEVFASFFGS